MGITSQDANAQIKRNAFAMIDLRSGNLDRARGRAEMLLKDIQGEPEYRKAVPLLKRAIAGIDGGIKTKQDYLAIRKSFLAVQRALQRAATRAKASVEACDDDHEEEASIGTALIAQSEASGAITVANLGKSPDPKAGLIEDDVETDYGVEVEDAVEEAIKEGVERGLDRRFAERLRTQSGDGKTRSRGHLAFVGSWEYFLGPSDQIYRAKRSTGYYDTKTGYKVNGRAQGPARLFGVEMAKAHGFTPAQIRQIGFSESRSSEGVVIKDTGRGPIHVIDTGPRSSSDTVIISPRGGQYQASYRPGKKSSPVTSVWGEKDAIISWARKTLRDYKDYISVRPLTQAERAIMSRASKAGKVELSDLGVKAAAKLLRDKWLINSRGLWYTLTPTGKQIARNM